MVGYIHVVFSHATTKFIAQIYLITFSQDPSCLHIQPSSCYTLSTAHPCTYTYMQVQFSHARTHHNLGRQKPQKCISCNIWKTKYWWIQGCFVGQSFSYFFVPHTPPSKKKSLVLLRKIIFLHQKSRCVPAAVDTSDTGQLLSM